MGGVSDADYQAPLLDRGAPLAPPNLLLSVVSPLVSAKSLSTLCSNNDKTTCITLRLNQINPGRLILKCMPNAYDESSQILNLIMTGVGGEVSKFCSLSVTLTTWFSKARMSSESDSECILLSNQKAFP